MLSLRNQSRTPQLPEGYILKKGDLISSQALNRLFARSNQETYSPKRLSLAIKKSSFHLSIIAEASNKICGFVRATSDKGLNANLWNLTVEPCKEKEQLMAVLVYEALRILKTTMPGCSVSIAAPSSALKALKNNGFVIDPNGIRAMGIRLRI